MGDRQGEKRGAARVVRRLLLRRCDRLLRREVVFATLLTGQRRASDGKCQESYADVKKKLIIPNKAPLGGSGEREVGGSTTVDFLCLEMSNPPV